jgi:DNA-directed RNA polymerase specialized sigma24 family protein
MTDSSLPDPLRAYLADPRVRRSLANLVQTRVPARDAEDVVQSVLCAALAAEVVPAEASHIPRWIAGIARHKVADAHRRAYREQPTEDAEVAVPAPAFEMRQIAERVACEAAEDGAARRTLEWIAREHDGETWAEIARAERLPGAVVRKRISRFRRALRVRWLGALVLLVAAGFSTRALRRSTSEILPDDPRGSALAGSGDWRIDHVDVDSQAAPEVQALARLEAQSARIHVEGGRVRFTSPLRTTTYVILAERRDAETSETLVLRDEAGHEHRVSVSRPDPRAEVVEVRIDEGKWRGTIALRR